MDKVIKILLRFLSFSWPLLVVIIAVFILTLSGYIDWQAEDSQWLKMMSPLVIVVMLITGFMLTRASDVVRRIRHKNHHLLRMIEQSAELLLVADTEGKIVYVNPAFEKSSGYYCHELVGNSISILKSGSHEDDFYTDMWQTISAGKTFESIFVNRRKDGALFYEDKVIMPIFRRGEICQYVSCGRDISDHNALQKRSQELENLAHFDLLTGLYNSAAIVQYIDEALVRAAKNGTLVALAYIDLDGFVPINNAYGHKIGDKYLQHVSRCINEALRNKDKAARLSGDEFLLVLEGFADESEVLASVDTIRQNACVPVDLDNVDMEVRMSIGVALCQGEVADINSVIAEAEHGMHLAKQHGGNRVEMSQDLNDYYVATKETPLRMM